MTQQRLAERVGVSRGYIANVERGRANPTLEMVARIADALGLELALSIRQPPVLGADQRDIVHAWCSGYVDRRLVAAGWQTAREVELVHGRSHGWIDLLAFDPRTGTLLVIEIKTRLDDVGAVERQLAWYERGAWSAAAALAGDHGACCRGYSSSRPTRPTQPSARTATSSPGASRGESARWPPTFLIRAHRQHRPAASR